MRDAFNAIGSLAGAFTDIGRGIGCLFAVAAGGWILAVTFFVLWLLK